MVAESVVAASVVNKVVDGTLVALASVAGKAAVLDAVSVADTLLAGTSVTPLLVAVLVAGTLEADISMAPVAVADTLVDTHPSALDLLQVPLVPLGLFSYQISSVSTTLLVAIYFISYLDGTFGLTLGG